jgi:flavin reductase (DIM6/NTAB) family NADH-FMN oxidoreductase RutF
MPTTDLAPLLGRIPSGLFIVTACAKDGRETGLLASWVQQASFEPPMLTVAVNARRYLHDWLTQSPLLGVSVIGEGQKEFLKHFGAGFEPDQPAFEGIAVTRGVTGVPCLEHALGTLEGKIVDRMTTGDHVIYAVEVLGAVAGTVAVDTAPWVHVRKNGLRY